MVTGLMLASLALGILAWLIPILILVKRKSHSKKMGLYSFISMSFCSIAIYLHIVLASYYIDINDLSAIMDTIFASYFLSGALLIGTILLNTIVMIVNLRRK